VYTSPACLLYKAMADWNKPPAIDLSIYASTFLPLFLLSFFFIVRLCRALAALGFGSSLPLCAEKRSSLFHESEGILCCFARKAPVRRHESTTVISVLRVNFACQHNWRLRWGRSIERSPARSCYVESVIDILQSTTVT
jgi:hypothetical protein